MKDDVPIKSPLEWLVALANTINFRADVDAGTDLRKDRVHGHRENDQHDKDRTDPATVMTNGDDLYRAVPVRCHVGFLLQVLRDGSVENDLR